MSEQEPPVRITDKRKEKAEAARRRAEEVGHPSVQGSSEAVLTVNRLERIHELTKKAKLPTEEGGAPALSDEEQAELLRLQAEEDAAAEEEAKQAENTIEARTAFYVVLMHDGSVRVEPDCNTLLSLDHMPTVDEMYTGMSLGISDIQAAKAARHTMFQLQQQASAGMSRRLAQPPSGIVPPGRR